MYEYTQIMPTYDVYLTQIDYFAAHLANKCKIPNPLGKSFDIKHVP